MIDEPLASTENIRMLSVKHVAELLDVSTPTVRRYAKSGEIPMPVRVGKFLRWRASDLLAYLDSKASEQVGA